MAPLVRLEHLTKTYQEAGQTRVVLSDLNAEIDTGRITVIRGRSGSGKSTLLNLIAGLDDPNSGEIRIAGEVVSRMSPRQRAIFRRRHIGFVFQFFNLIPTLTVLENVRLPAELAGRPETAASESARQLLREVGLDDRHSDFPDRLSGGEQQRVAIARALIGAPALVLADEPTGNLDRPAGEAVLSLMRSLMRERGVTVLLATHSHRIAASADTRLLLVDGQLVPDEGPLE
ncbi:MAG TPA: ABC transporter ATP-binding protein [Anaerolineales bacterium]